MGKQTTKKQHYVPKFYLNKFADEGGNLSVYKRLDDKFFISNPKDMCYKDFFYETEFEVFTEKDNRYVNINDIENYLSEKELMHSNFLNRILKIFDANKIIKENLLILNSTEKQDLKSFVTNMLIRNPASFKNKYKINTSNESLSMFNQYHNKWFYEMFNNSNAMSHISEIIKKDSFNEKSETGEASFIYNQIDEMYFVIYRAKEENFITSSRPVIFITNDNNFSYITFPLNIKYLVFFTNDTKYKRVSNRMWELNRSEVIKINSHHLNFDVEYCEYIIANNKKNLEDAIIENIKVIKKMKNEGK